MKTTLCLLMVMLVSCQAQVEPQYHSISTQFSKTVNLDYLLYVPPGYVPNEAWPLVVYLTGLESVDDINTIRNFGPPRLVEMGMEYDYFIVAPQLPGDVHWDPDALNALVEEIQNNYHIDSSQRFITGIGDRGGWGIYEFGVSYPGIFQRFAPISAPACTEICRLGDVSTWIFHGALDTIVPLADAENMLYEMQFYCDTNDQLTIYDDLGHEIWEEAYSEEGFWEWFVGSTPTFTSPAAVASEETFSTTISKDFDDNYLLYLPVGYEDNNANWPLVVFLHGSGSAIDYIDDIRLGGPPMLFEQGMNSDFMLLCPQLHANVHWDVDRINALTQRIIDTYRIDESRIYITGLSRGGFGTWEYAVSYPNLFAGIVPIAARDIPGVERLANSNVAIFHGALDNGVPWQGSQFMYNRLQNVGANVTLTLYEGVGHNAWSQAYGSDGLWTWLLNQQNNAVSVSEDDIYSSEKPRLAANYPNPFNPSTTISYSIPVQTRITLTIFDMLGREIFNLLDATQTPGHYKTLWTGANNSGDLVKAGVYFCQLQAEDHTRTLKMVYMK
ncbi:MAG: T9SS type A sorting domain-containing protein [Candidatus Marinimicrobia bacterium]|jgi:predicted peptidase|nr:T9SS type A sorting domain-containing protein [Candidatus Neomarinimicrobiota bacterium]MBT3631147.1 T9SS type A sorting domain-containing protein [Candidatus Neomarinimicrobiota bacterium]MBT3825045.1 T9SS type A sorting domain-containing protein [Candidatus Neomarinimicrobiota bacterium]MBT4131388.1 T9SS type A sorting domain-containing protein [Candidatus Neomarinimicrobiota bacterium]MBT4296867.1 T9SS type A sorting domain-containing protein [Candidatus Neomarinimicrobiota bacterium]